MYTICNVSPCVSGGPNGHLVGNCRRDSMPSFIFGPPNPNYLFHWVSAPPLCSFADQHSTLESVTVIRTFQKYTHPGYLGHFTHRHPSWQSIRECITRGPIHCLYFSAQGLGKTMTFQEFPFWITIITTVAEL